MILYSENATFTADNVEVKQGETKPSKHFTESTLLAVMENIDRLIDDMGKYVNLKMEEFVGGKKKRSA